MAHIAADASKVTSRDALAVAFTCTRNALSRQHASILLDELQSLAAAVVRRSANCTAVECRSESTLSPAWACPLQALQGPGDAHATPFAAATKVRKRILAMS